MLKKPTNQTKPKQKHEPRLTCLAKLSSKSVGGDKESFLEKNTERKTLIL